MKGVAAAAAVAAAIALSGCAASRGAPAGPVVSPSGIVYEPGTPPTETRSSQTARLYLRQDRVERALELALEGISEDPENPIHFFLAGAAAARLRDYAAADTLFSEAQRIYPAYEIEIEPEREAAWGQAFNAGLEAYALGDVDGTIEVWQHATLIYDLRPEAHRNLASLLAVEGSYPESIDVYQRALAGLAKRPATRVLAPEDISARDEAVVEIEAELADLLLLTDRFAEAEPLFRRRLERDPTNLELQAQLAATLSGQGRDAEAREIYSALLSEESLEATQLFNLGVGLFRASEFSEAAEAFRRLTETQPDSRDAWFNYANALFAAEAWESLAAAGDRLIELDPLGENGRLIIARAQLEMGDREAALASMEGIDQAPVYVDQLRMQRSGATTSVLGRVTGNAAPAGTPITLRFAFYEDAGALLGTESLIVSAPATGEDVSLEVRFRMRAAAYRYELVGG